MADGNKKINSKSQKENARHKWPELKSREQLWQVHRKLNITKEMIAEPEDESMETLQIGTQREKGIFKKQQQNH